MLVLNSNVIPYENEPLAVPGQEVLNVEQDIDGISPDALESWFNVNISVNVIKPHNAFFTSRDNR